ncbi:MAG: hypothetical protein AAGA65_26425 [Actinomycetota bacterium]
MNTTPNPPNTEPRRIGPILVELVDALVVAVDLDRASEVDRVTRALEPFGASRLFTDELRLNGTPSSESWERR